MTKAAFYKGNHTFIVDDVTATAPSEGMVTVDVAYCGICGTDMHVFHGNMDKRVGHSRIIGHEMSGTISAVGANVTKAKIGQKVAVRPLVSCGHCPACEAGQSHICHHLKFLGLDADGAMQEKWNVPEDTLHFLPEGISLRDAALVEPVAVACHDVKRAQVKNGEFVAVIGGGPIGILIAIVARHAGGKVVVSEPNPNRIEIAKKLGFDVINPVSSDLAGEINQRTDNKGADVVFEVSGTQAGVDAMTAIAATRARIAMVAIHATKPQIDLFQFFWRELELLGARLYDADDFDMAIKLIAKHVIPADQIITDIAQLENIQEAFLTLNGNPTAMKSLIKINTVSK